MKSKNTDSKNHNSILRILLGGSSEIVYFLSATLELIVCIFIWNISAVHLDKTNTFLSLYSIYSLF